MNAMDLYVYDSREGASTYSEVSRLARKIFIAAPKSSLDSASSSGFSAV